VLVKVSVVVDGTFTVTVIVRVGPVFIGMVLFASTGVGLGSFLFLDFVFLAVEMTIGIGTLFSSTLTITREVLVAVVVDRIMMVLLAVEVFVSMTL
jgi:hypothetical protein